MKIYMQLPELMATFVEYCLLPVGGEDYIL